MTSTSRRGLLGMAGAGAALAVGLGACGKDDDDDGDSARGPAIARGGSRARDIEIVNYLLTIEYLEAELYDRAIRSGQFPRAERERLERFGEHEHQHVRALTAAVGKLGGAPAAQPEATFELDDRLTTLKTAYRLENLGAAAYLGQLNRVHDTELLAALLSIHSVDGRHAATLNTMLDKDIAPTGAFATPAAMDDVLVVIGLFTTP